MKKIAIALAMLVALSGVQVLACMPKSQKLFNDAITLKYDKVTFDNGASISAEAIQNSFESTYMAVVSEVGLVTITVKEIKKRDDGKILYTDYVVTSESGANKEGFRMKSNYLANGGMTRGGISLPSYIDHVIGCN